MNIILVPKSKTKNTLLHIGIKVTLPLVFKMSGLIRSQSNKTLTTGKNASLLIFSKSSNKQAAWFIKSTCSMVKSCIIPLESEFKCILLFSFFNCLFNKSPAFDKLDRFSLSLLDILPLMGGRPPLSRMIRSTSRSFSASDVSSMTESLSSLKVSEKSWSNSPN